MTSETQTFKKYIDLKEEMDSIKEDRKEKGEEMKKTQGDIIKILEQKPDKRVYMEKYLFYLKTEETRETLNYENLKVLLTQFLGDGKQGEKAAEYVWENRNKKQKQSLKFSEPKGPKNKR